MKISRYFDFPNKETFKIKPFKQTLDFYLQGKDIIIDAYANSSKYGNITNDLNPSFQTDYNMDANDFIQLFKQDYADVVLFDPPYSPRQVKECYEGFGKTVTQKDTQSGKYFEFMKRAGWVIKDNGYFISFGWNTTGIGKKNGFRIVEIVICNHGDWSNDTFMVVEQKYQSRLNFN